MGNEINDQVKKKKTIYWHSSLSLFGVMLSVSAYLGICKSEMIGIIILLAGLFVAIILIARSGEDENLDTRTNYELIKFYTKTAYFFMCCPWGHSNYNCFF